MKWKSRPIALVQPSFRIVLRSGRYILTRDNLLGTLRRLSQRQIFRLIPLYSHRHACHLQKIFLNRKPPNSPHTSWLTLLPTPVYLLNGVRKMKRRKESSLLYGFLSFLKLHVWSFLLRCCFMHGYCIIAMPLYGDAATEWIARILNKSFVVWLRASSITFKCRVGARNISSNKMW